MAISKDGNVMRKAVQVDGSLSKAERKRRQNRINQQAYRQREAAKAAAVESVGRHGKASAPGQAIQIVLLAQVKGKSKRTTQNRNLKQSVQYDSIIPAFENATPDASPSDNASTALECHAEIGPANAAHHIQNISVPNLIYWEWAVQHPETMPEDEIHSLQQIGSIDGFNRPLGPAFRFPISSDHKIMIIQYNLYRAMKINKDLLSPWLKPCPASSKITRIPEGLVPPCLQPTALQQAIVHPNWIAIFPHPQIRDNLLLRQHDTCWDDMMMDLIGYIYPCHTQCEHHDHSYRSEDDHDDSSDVANGGHGLIVWGDPWDIANWELTPAFIRKWRWTLKGCQDMIHISNKWRALRHEPPIQEILD